MTTNSLNINNDGLPVFTASTGKFAAVELTSKGDTLTRTSSIYVAKPAGADGDLLTPDSTQSSGLNYKTITSGSAVTFIASQIAASSSSINFTTGWNDAIYAYYEFTYTNVRPATDGADFWIRVSVNGGSSYLTSNYHWAAYRLSSSDGSDTNSGSSSDSKIRVIDTVGNAAGEGISGKILYFPSANPGTNTPSTFAHDSTVFRNNGTMYRSWGSGMNPTSSIINAVRFVMSSGNIATGTFKFYGIKNS